MNNQAVITGDFELMAKLEMLGRKSLTAVLKPAVNKGLNPIMQKAKQNCKWNSLRKLIGKKTGKTKKGTISGKVYMKPSKERTIKLNGRDVGFEAVANILEFGSSKQNIRPQPFMRPARQQAHSQALTEFQKEAESRLKKLAESGKDTSK